jgi:hypothetical protein
MKFSALAASTAFVATSVLAAAPAAAASSYDPNVTRIANPAKVCKSIPGSILNAGALLGIPVDVSDFDYADCVTTLARGEAFVEPAEEFGSPYAQCDFLIQNGIISLPYVFHDTDSEEDVLLPDLKANNRKQCGSALYAFHSIFTALFAPPGAP